MLRTLENIFGSGVRIVRKEPLYGSSLNRTLMLTLSTGDFIFVKRNSANRLDMLQAEAEGLEAIRGTDCIPTPEIYGCGIDEEERTAFLLLEYVEESRRVSRDSWERFGGELARMHRADTAALTEGAKYGFRSDNCIGLTPQKNALSGSWIEFFRTSRLEPQLKRAEAYFGGTELKKFSYLLEHLDRWLTEPDKPALLHGDLWGGNALCGADGVIRLIDPAVYVGNREADLAMTGLFGGFPDSFYRGYEEAAPLNAGYRDRRDLYNLYHLLNHLNLFGRGYLGEVVSVLNRYAS